MAQEYITRSFEYIFDVISLKIKISDDKKDMTILPIVNGEERLYFLGLDPVVEASVVIASDKYLNSILEGNNTISQEGLDEMVVLIQTMIEQSTFSDIERKMLLQRLIIHYDFLIKNKLAHLHREIEEGRLKPVKEYK